MVLQRLVHQTLKRIGCYCRELLMNVDNWTVIIIIIYKASGPYYSLPDNITVHCHGCAWISVLFQVIIRKKYKDGRTQHTLRILRSVNQRLPEQPRVYTEFGKRSFSHLSHKTWNSLPLELRLAPTFDTFKRRLKTYLFG